MLEKDCSAKALYDETQSLLANRKRRDAMTTALQQDVILDSVERICDILEALAKQKR